jgi:uncharacterized membrane protein required for colicin V production
VVDIVLIGLLLIFAFNGYRQGFVVGLLSFAGFFSGALVGLQISPYVANRFDTDASKVLVSLIVIFGLAVLGQAVAGFLGSRLRGGSAIAAPSGSTTPAERWCPSSPCCWSSGWWPRR